MLRPDPDGVAGQLSNDIDGCGFGILIALQIDVLSYIVKDSAVGDSILVRQDIAAELRATGQVDSAPLGQVDACALCGADECAVLGCVAVLGKLRTAVEVHRHRVLQIDRTTLVCIAAADHSVVFDVQFTAAPL